MEIGLLLITLVLMAVVISTLFIDESTVIKPTAVLTLALCGWIYCIARDWPDDQIERLEARVVALERGDQTCRPSDGGSVP